jgi:heavy metal response regulator
VIVSSPKGGESKSSQRLDADEECRNVHSRGHFAVRYGSPEAYIERLLGGILPMRILVVEDEKKVASFIKRGLEEEGYAVDVAYDGEAGLGMALDGVHDLIILDIQIPRMDGLRVLQELRRESVSKPVLLLTVRATIEDKVLGLDAGADDYLTKPFAFQELVARVRALLRRRAEVEPVILQVADLSLDPAKHAVFRGDEKIDLTPREFALLDYFMRNPGRVLTRTMIAQHVWDYDFDTMTNIIDVYVNYLRKKIDAGKIPKLIHTVRGVGYMLKAG